MTTSRVSAAELNECAREPIHIPGAIQPHGVLLAVREPELVVTQVSVNASSLLGIEALELVGRGLEQVVGPDGISQINAAIATGAPQQESPLTVVIGGREFDALLHRHDGVLIIELEPAQPGAGNFARYHRRLQAALEQLQKAPDLSALYEVAARVISDLTGYERVMVYRFDADWHGEVVGEALTGEVDSYMGLHFPASDIPEQARALYAKSWLRIIPTVDYAPAALEPACNPLTSRPLDLSFAVLRSVSPVHLEYLRNMDVGASMSISLMVDGKLWGLIACHHREARPLPYAVRAACELFGQVTSREITAKRDEQQLAGLAESRTIQTRFFDVITQEENAAAALLKYTPSLLAFMGASGAAISIGGQCNLVGQTPHRDQIRALLAWLEGHNDGEPVFRTDSLSDKWPPAAEFKAVASGLLAVSLSRVESQWVLWFRPEVLTTITWAGNPHKPVEPGLRLHPRKSFAAWQEVLTGRSTPWSENEVDGAHELRLALNALVIRRSDKLLKLNAELEQKNTDLNSFAYIASHDLHEPLRGIYHFSRFLREDHGAELAPEALRKVDTIGNLALRTEELLKALAHFSRIGRMELNPRETDLQRLVDEVLESLSATITEDIEIRRPRLLPSVHSDPVLLREVFANLISNAIKYNTRPDKWVEISYRDPVAGEEQRGPVFFVRDNGIGIRERNYEAVFKMFRRLHAKDQFSGTGAGLAIVKSIIERHGGRIWVESTYGEGSTFLFTLK